MSFFHSFLLSETSHLGRLDYSSFSQQALMEMFVEHLQEKTKFQDSKRHFLDICDWKGVACNTQREVTEIVWAYDDDAFFHPGGRLSYQYIPETVEWFEIADNGFDGSFLFSQLPFEMEYLDISGNKFIGTLDFQDLPRPMQILYLNGNHFEGSLCLTELPNGLKDFRVHENNFSGSIDLSRLPQNLCVFEIDGTHLHAMFPAKSMPIRMEECVVREIQLHTDIALREFPSSIFYIKLWENGSLCTIDMAALPHRLKKLSISGNHILQPTLDFSVFPQTICLIVLAKDNLTGTISWRDDLSNLSNVNFAENAFHGKINTSSFPRGLRDVILSKNRFDGSLNLKKLPPRLFTLDVSENEICGSLDLENAPATLISLKVSRNAFSRTTLSAWKKKKMSLPFQFVYSSDL